MQIWATVLSYLQSAWATGSSLGKRLIPTWSYRLADRIMPAYVWYKCLETHFVNFPNILSSARKFWVAEKNRIDSKYFMPFENVFFFIYKLFPTETQVEKIPTFAVVQAKTILLFFDAVHPNGLSHFFLHFCSHNRRMASIETSFIDSHSDT